METDILLDMFAIASSSTESVDLICCRPIYRVELRTNMLDGGQLFPRADTARLTGDAGLLEAEPFARAACARMCASTTSSAGARSRTAARPVVAAWLVAAMNAEADCVEVTSGISLRYGCETSLLPPALAACFVPLGYDDAAQRFVADALAAPHGRARTAIYQGLRRVLSDYDAYGLLGMYPMHLLSAPQLAALLSEVPRARPRSLLDVGAGDGSITTLAAPLFDDVRVTERSRVMRRRLAARGYRVIALDLEREALPDGERAHAVLCLNVVDRCLRPRTLLRHLASALAPSGRLVLSVPLPLQPHVQAGGHTLDPDEPMPPAQTFWEASAASVALELLEPAGLGILRLCRVPYLCHGDAQNRLYALDAAVFVCASSGSG
jgi:SAM-dependent methyltransferase